MSGLPVRLADVRFGYGRDDVLRGVGLAIDAGESVLLLGPNGAGKTTLTRLLVALARPRTGEVRVGDWDASRRRPDQMASRVGYVFQHPDQQLFARTVREDVAFGPRRLGLPDEAAAEVLAELGLSPLAGSHPYDLPPPVRKLVALAGILAMRTPVLVLDEPTAGMDRALRSRVIDALGRRLKAGVTVLAVSHDLVFAAEIAGRIVVLSEGRVAADRPARDLLTDPPALAALGLRPPPAAALGLALGLPGRPVRAAECVAALAGARWR
jgi:energy-coupling factor transport system ATP-binding protein